MNPSLETTKKPYTPPIFEQHNTWQLLTGGSDFGIQDVIRFDPLEEFETPN